jgi:hypothetical protein
MNMNSFYAPSADLRAVYWRNEHLKDKATFGVRVFLPHLARTAIGLNSEYEAKRYAAKGANMSAIEDILSRHIVRLIGEPKIIYPPQYLELPHKRWYLNNYSASITNTPKKILIEDNSGPSGLARAYRKAYLNLLIALNFPKFIVIIPN